MAITKRKPVQKGVSKAAESRHVRATATSASNPKGKTAKKIAPGRATKGKRAPSKGASMPTRAKGGERPAPQKKAYSLTHVNLGSDSEVGVVTCSACGEKVWADDGETIGAWYPFNPCEHAVLQYSTNSEFAAYCEGGMLAAALAQIGSDDDDDDDEDEEEGEEAEGFGDSMSEYYWINGHGSEIEGLIPSHFKKDAIEYTISGHDDIFIVVVGAELKSEAGEDESE